MPRHFGLRLASCLSCCLILSLVSCAQETPEPTFVLTETPIATPTRASGETISSDTTTTPPAVTESALIHIRRFGQMRIGVLYNYPPFGVLAKDGQVTGYEVELMRQMAQRWEVEPVFVQVTRQTRLPMLLEGQVDVLAAAMPHRRDLEPYAEFSQTTFISGYTALVKSGSQIESVTGLGGIPMAVVGSDTKTAVDTYAASVGMSINAQVVGEISEAVGLLNAGTVQAIAARREELMLAATSIEESVVLADYFQAEPYAFAVQRGDMPLRDLIDLTLQVMASEAVLSDIFTTSFFGYPADPFLIVPGDPTYSFADFPTTVASVTSTIERLR